MQVFMSLHQARNGENTPSTASISGSVVLWSTLCGFLVSSPMALCVPTHAMFSVSMLPGCYMETSGSPYMLSADPGYLEVGLRLNPPGLPVS